MTGSVGGFATVIGHELVGELAAVAPRPYVVVTMADLWPRFAPLLDRGHLAAVHLIESLELADLQRAADALPRAGAVIGLGGGQAVDVAKIFAWIRRLPLFQAPTATSVDAAFGHRAGVRIDGHVRYLGWAVPETVYVDLDVIRSAPPLLNRSGVGDILCFQTAHVDWAIARDNGRCEARWPYDQGLVDEARRRLASVMAHLDEIREVTDTGIRTLVDAHRWSGATYHDAGWNPRHIEGVDHHVFYNLERLTGRHFIHGQVVGLGTSIGAAWQGSGTEGPVGQFHRAGVDIRPEAMGITWDDVHEAVRTLPAYVREAGLPSGVVDDRPAPEGLVEDVRQAIEAAFGAPAAAATRETAATR